ncbi:KOW motif-containing protein [Paenibacillus sp. NRS-1775]|uniref:KOW motif-containing protein n=1 Tax=unclassified Paenibacillus TaxID=185978 RepID=UPI003D2798E6
MNVGDSVEIISGKHKGFQGILVEGYFAKNSITKLSEMIWCVEDMDGRQRQAFETKIRKAKGKKKSNESKLRHVAAIIRPELQEEYGVRGVCSSGNKYVYVMINYSISTLSEFHHLGLYAIDQLDEAILKHANPKEIIYK